jgi:hypothetical protein
MRLDPETLQIVRCGYCSDPATEEITLEGPGVDGLVVDLCSFHADVIQRHGRRTVAEPPIKPLP